MEIQTNYDEVSDVLYISFIIPLPCVREEVDVGDGHCIIIGKHNGRINGITIIDASKQLTEQACTLATGDSKEVDK